MSGTPRLPSWGRLPASVRALGRWLTIVQLVGYTTSLVFVWLTTDLTPAGVADHYRGVDPDSAGGAMQFPKSLAEMLTITHTHLLSMAVIFLLSGAALLLCSRPSERWKHVLVVEPFIALLVSFASMWLMRYADARFSWLLEASSVTMALAFYLQTYFILRDLARPPEPGPS
ncbi:MAG: hypothetical protein ACREMO_06560 [Gemmatimonadales bacterium]